MQVNYAPVDWGLRASHFTNADLEIHGKIAGMTLDRQQECRAHEFYIVG